MHIYNILLILFLVQEVSCAVEHINILSKEDIAIPIQSVLQDILNQVTIAFYGQDIK